MGSDGAAASAAAGECGKLRLFVALLLPGAVREALAAWASEVTGRDAALRLVAVDALHVTLCFLGATAPDGVAGIVAACREAVADAASPVTLALGDALWLPRRRPRVLAVDLADTGGVAAALQARLSAALVSGGWYEAEARRWLPHVTVARVRGREGRASGASAVPPAPALEAFGPEAVALMRSRLGPDGARYEIVTAMPLR